MNGMMARDFKENVSGTRDSKRVMHPLSLPLENWGAFFPARLFFFPEPDVTTRRQLEADRIKDGVTQFRMHRLSSIVVAMTSFLSSRSFVMHSNTSLHRVSYRCVLP